MGIVLLSLFLSMVLGSITWLVLGEKFPPGEEVKFPPLNNIVIYSLLLLIPVYLAIFLIFSW